MTEEELLASVEAGRERFAQKKTASLYAVAHAAVVALAAAPAWAPQNARKWLRQELDKANKEVAVRNTQLKEERKKGQRIRKGKVTEETLAGEGVGDPGAELARLGALAELDDDEFKARQLVKIKYDQEDEKKDIESAAVIRFVFRLYERVNAPLVSRYAAVLDWIMGRFGHLADVDVEKIVAALQADGGFEAVLHAQRERNGGGGGSGAKSGGKSAAKSQAQNSSKVAGPITEAHRAETITVTMRMPSWLPELPKGAVSLYCVCTGPEEIEVIGFDYLDDDGLSHAQARFSSHELTTADPGGTAPGDSNQEQAAEDPTPETTD